MKQREIVRYSKEFVPRSDGFHRGVMFRMALFLSVAKRQLAGVACAVGLSLTIAAPIDAQEGEVIRGSECTTAARPVAVFAEILATPVADDGYEPLTSVPEGAAPDAVTVAEIEATVRQFIACSNSDEVLRGLSMYSDEFLRRAVNLPDDLDVDQALEIIESLATPAPTPEEDLVVFIAIHEMVQLPDGAVAVVLETDGGRPNPEGTDVALFIFEKIDGRWIITDAVNNIDDIEAQSTPEASS
jgi:hypothetical protein